MTRRAGPANRGGGVAVPGLPGTEALRSPRKGHCPTPPALFTPPNHASPAARCRSRSPHRPTPPQPFGSAAFALPTRVSVGGHPAKGSSPVHVPLAQPDPTPSHLLGALLSRTRPAPASGAAPARHLTRRRVPAPPHPAPHHPTLHVKTDELGSAPHAGGTVCAALAHPQPQGCARGP